MERAGIACMVAAAMIGGAASGRAGDDGARRDAASPDWPALNAAAREQAKSPIRAGVPGIRPFWNARARAFIHPPAFEFGDMDGGKVWRFELKPQDNHSSFVICHPSFGPDGSAVWTAPHPWLPVPGDVWDSLAPGYYTLRVEALGEDGTPLSAPVSERRFYRAAVFHGPYPAASRDYRDAAARVYAAVYNLPHVQAWLTSDDPPEGYDLYCYPAKILSSMIRALCRFAENGALGDRVLPVGADLRAARKNALAIARKMADWLIAHSQPDGAPLAHFPPTYWGDRRDVAVNYAGQNMLGYPAHAAQAYFDLAEATGETKYRDAALEIVDWCEDQFTVWSDPIHHMDWQHWKTPTALEQYDYYTPIDASMGDMIGAFAAAYRATGDALYLEKARALADNITRNQRADGTIPTYFDSRGGSDWVNCMVYVADRLEYLSGSEP